MNTVGSVSVQASARLYSCQIYDGNTLIRNYIPCINDVGEAGLWDNVNSVFYGNAGSGSFSASGFVETAAAVEYDPYLWYETDRPTAEQMTVYLLNVAAIRAVLDVIKTTPPVPVDMEDLLVQEANDIEQILLDIYRQLTIMPTTFIPGGEG